MIAARSIRRVRYDIHHFFTVAMRTLPRDRTRIVAGVENVVLMINSIVVHARFDAARNHMECGPATRLLPMNGASWYPATRAHPCRANAPALGGACYKENPFALFLTGRGGSHMPRRREWQARVLSP